MGCCSILISWLLEECLGEDGLEGTTDLLTKGNLINAFWGCNGLNFDIRDLVTGWHQVCDVDVLDEWLNSGTTKDLSLGHGLGDLTWGTFKASDQNVLEWTLCVLFECRDNNSLLTCITASEENDDLTGFDAIGLEG